MAKAASVNAQVKINNPQDDNQAQEITTSNINKTGNSSALPPMHPTSSDFLNPQFQDSEQPRRGSDSSNKPPSSEDSNAHASSSHSTPILTGRNLSESASTSFASTPSSTAESLLHPTNASPGDSGIFDHEQEISAASGELRHESKDEANGSERQEVESNNDIQNEYDQTLSSLLDYVPEPQAASPASSHIKRADIAAQVDREYKGRGLEEYVIIKTHEFSEFCKKQSILRKYQDVAGSRKLLKSKSIELLQTTQKQEIFADYCKALVSNGHPELSIPYALHYNNTHETELASDFIFGALGSLNDILES